MEAVAPGVGPVRHGDIPVGGYQVLSVSTGLDFFEHDPGAVVMQVEHIRSGRNRSHLTRQEPECDGERNQHTHQPHRHPPTHGQGRCEQRDQDRQNEERQREVWDGEAGRLEAGRVGSRVIAKREATAATDGIDRDLHPQQLGVRSREGLLRARTKA